MLKRLYFGLTMEPKETGVDYAYISLGKEFLQHMTTHKNPT